jgi:hypothetical protein
MSSSSLCSAKQLISTVRAPPALRANRALLHMSGLNWLRSAKLHNAISLALKNITAYRAASRSLSVCRTDKLGMRHHCRKTFCGRMTGPYLRGCCDRVGCARVTGSEDRPDEEAAASSQRRRWSLGSQGLSEVCASRSFAEAPCFCAPRTHLHSTKTLSAFAWSARSAGARRLEEVAVSNGTPLLSRNDANTEDLIAKFTFCGRSPVA